MPDIQEMRPSKKEVEFLTLAYNRFNDNVTEIFDKSFWEKDSYYRFSKLKDCFSIYSEILVYPPIGQVIKNLKTTRPPEEEMIAGELFKCIRNILIHFPLFSSWEETWFSSSLINWQGKSKSINSFFKKYSGREAIKYRVWDIKNKEMTYLSINFPNGYNTGKPIYLKDILTEKEGTKFSLVFMGNILSTQIASDPRASN